MYLCSNDFNEKDTFWRTYGLSHGRNFQWFVTSSNLFLRNKIFDVSLPIENGAAKTFILTTRRWFQASFLTSSVTSFLRRQKVVFRPSLQRPLPSKSNHCCFFNPPSVRWRRGNRRPTGIETLTTFTGRRRRSSGWKIGWNRTEAKQFFSSFFSFLVGDIHRCLLASFTS